VNRKNIRSLAKAPPPRSQADLNSFLGMRNMYPRSIKVDAYTAKPLTKLTRKKLPYVLPPLEAVQREALEYLKERLTSTPILALLWCENLFILDTDDCAFQVGCTLLVAVFRGSCPQSRRGITPSEGPAQDAQQNIAETARTPESQCAKRTRTTEVTQTQR